jgi:drug/metabolite transporter (DMT)-like permease
MASSRALLSGIDERRRGQIFVVVAAILWSTAGILQRELDLGTTTQMAGRAFFGGLALLVFTVYIRRGRLRQTFLAIGLSGLALAACMAISNTTFILALNHTTVANVLFMQALAPIAAALIARLTLSEQISRRSAAAMIVALLGVGVMVGGPGANPGIGLGITFVMTLAFAAVIVITRHRRDISMLPALALSQLLALAAIGPFSHPGSIDSHDLSLLIALGVGQMALGLALFSVGARLIPASECALLTLLEVVLGPIWVWLAISEQPSAATLLGGAIVLIAVAFQATAQSTSPSYPHTEPLAEPSQS